MNKTIQSISLLTLLILASCAKPEIHHRHQVRFVHFNTGKALPGETIRLDRTIYDLDYPLGHTEYYGTMVTDLNGKLSFDVSGDFTYSVVSDTLRGPFMISMLGQQGELKDGVVTCSLYPFTKLVFIQTAGNYLSADIGARPDPSVPNYNVIQGDGVFLTPNSISKETISVLTHRPNSVHVRVTLKDSSVVEHDYTISPENFDPITLTIPH